MAQDINLGVRSVSQQLEALQSMAARGAGLIALAVSAKEMASALIDARLAADKLKNSLEFSTGGMAGAAREIEYLRTVTRTMGLDFATASQAYAKFAASARGAGMSLADTRATFEGVSAAGARFGLSADEMGGAFLALGQMASKGVVSMEELRGQLGERLPGAFSIAANAMGVTQAELIKMVESGKLASADFLPRFAQALKEIEAPLGSLQQELNRTKSAWDLWKQDLVAGGGGSGFLSHFTDSINDSSAAMRRLGDDTNVVIKYMAAVKAFEFKFLTGKSLFDPQQLQGQKRQEVHELQKVQDALELSASKNSGYLSPLNRSQLNDTIGRIKELRIELAGLAMQRGKEVGFQASDIKGDFERRRAAENARLKAYGEDTKYASKTNTAQAQLDALDAQGLTLDGTLATARAQLDALRGIDTSILSISAALDKFQMAVKREETSGASGNIALPNGVKMSEAAKMLQDFVSTHPQTSDAAMQPVYDYAMKAGMSSAQVAAVFNQAGISIKQSDVEDWAKRMGYSTYGGTGGPGAPTSTITTPPPAGNVMQIAEQELRAAMAAKGGIIDDQLAMQIYNYAIEKHIPSSSVAALISKVGNIPFAQSDVLTWTAKMGLPAFANGGITRGISIAGEAGPEAIVPLPNGRSIPVQMQRNSGGDATAGEIRALREQLDRLLSKIENNTRNTADAVNGANSAPILVEIAA